MVIHYGYQEDSWLFRLTLVVFDATVVLVFVFFLSSFGLIGFNDVSFDDVETGRSFAVLVGATTGGLINLKTES